MSKKNSLRLVFNILIIGIFALVTSPLLAQELPESNEYDSSPEESQITPHEPLVVPDQPIQNIENIKDIKDKSNQTNNVLNKIDSKTESLNNEISIIQDNYTNHGLFQALNKITTKISKLDIEVKNTNPNNNKDTKTSSEVKINNNTQLVKFGNLEITLHKCWQAKADEEPESKALIEVWEQVPGEEKKQIFFGWMFASSPAISAIEHPIYDLSLIKCY